MLHLSYLILFVIAGSQGHLEEGQCEVVLITLCQIPASFWDFSIDLWNCSDSVVFFLVHFTNPIIYLHYTFLNNVSLSDLTFIQKPFDMHHICTHYFHYPFQDYMLSLYNSCWKTPLQILIQINTSLQQLS